MGQTRVSYRANEGHARAINFPLMSGRIKALPSDRAFICLDFQDIVPNAGLLWKISCIGPYLRVCDKHKGYYYFVEKFYTYVDWIFW